MIARSTVRHRSELVFALSILVLASSCRCASTKVERSERATGPAPAAASASSSSPDASTPKADAATADAAHAGSLGPLEAPGPLVPLAVPGFRDAVVSVPLGARSPRPVMVALHGNFDRPEWQCEVWRKITGGQPFILCPRGIPRTDAPRDWDRWTYGARKATENELFAALDALKSRFSAHADDGPVLYTAFSLGAIYGAHTVVEHAERFPRVVLIEGGYESWSRTRARKYATGGGLRILFACGQTACRNASRGVVRTLEKENIVSRVVFGGNIGHTYDGPVAAAIEEAWDWLVEGDERFAPSVR